MTIKELELKLTQLDQATFQTLCDQMFRDLGYNVVPFGVVEGENKTRKGTPDSYAFDSGSYVFFEYTTQKDKLLEKFKSDLLKCFQKAQKFKDGKLTKIVIAINNNKIDPITLDEIIKKCSEQSIDFQLFCLSDICNFLIKHKGVLKLVLNVSIADYGIQNLNDFVLKTKKNHGVDHSGLLIGRDKEKEKIIEAINGNEVVVLYGDPGVGKSMLAIKSIEELGRQVFCMKSNSNDFIEELLSLTSDSNDYIVFIDDVNEVPMFKTFLESLDDQFYKHVKIICTVRNYALDGVKNILDHFKDLSYRFLQIQKLTDNIICDILSKNLGIINPTWLDRISFLAKGNPRLAFMAGEVAKEKGVENLIDSRSVMIQYFKQYTNNETSALINKHYDILGVLAFLKRIDIKNTQSILKILELCHISKELFDETLKDLITYELVDIYENQVVQIQDQNLSDYIIEVAFFEKKICSLSELVVELIGSHHKNVVESLEILLNVYSSKETSEYIRNEVNKAWNILDSKNSNDLNVFVSTCFIFDPDRAVLFISKQLEKQYKEYTGDISLFDKTYNRNEYIRTLFDICVATKRKTALDLMFKYLDCESLRNDCFEVIKEFAILKPEMFSDGKIKNPMLFEIEKYESSKWFDYVTTQVIGEALKYRYEFRTITTDKQITFSFLEIKDKYTGIIDYRNKIWNMAKKLSDKYKYQVIDLVINESFYYEDTKQIFTNDLKNINELIASITEIDETCEKLLKVKFSSRIVESPLSLKDFAIHSDTDLNIYVLILDPRDKRISYDERKSRQNREIVNLASSINQDSILRIFNICNECLKDNNGWKVREFLSVLIPSIDAKISESLVTNESLFSSLSCFIRLSLIDFIVNENNALKYISLISAYQKEISNDCLIALFNKIGKNDLNDNLVSSFHELIKEDLKLISNSIVRRRTDTICKIVGFNAQFIEILETIFSYADNNYSKVYEWLNLLFDPYVFKPYELVSLFNNNQKIDFLEKLFLWFVKHRIHEYELNKYFFEICSIDNNFLVSCTKALLDYKEHFSSEIFHELWKREDSNVLADIIFNTIVNDENHFSFYSLSAEQIFISDRDKENDKKFIKWAEEKILSISSKKSLMILNNYVSHCPIDLCKKYFDNLITKKIEIETFAEILTYPTHYGWVGSEINAVNAKIERLEIILNLIPDSIEFIKYRNTVESYISSLRERINQIKIKERLKFDDYF